VRRGNGKSGTIEGPPALALVDVSTDGTRPLPTGVSELDRVMGGGVVAGSVTLVFGPPGVGKSTLLFQVLASVAATGLDVMLASAEESLAQVSGAGPRASERCPRTCWPLRGPDVEAIEAAVERHRPALVVVDSLQSVSDPSWVSRPAAWPRCAPASSG
jgi:DNA repair protein RadA/Sms